MLGGNSTRGVVRRKLKPGKVSNLGLEHSLGSGENSWGFVKQWLKLAIHQRQKQKSEEEGWQEHTKEGPLTEVVK